MSFRDEIEAELNFIEKHRAFSDKLLGLLSKFDNELALECLAMFSAVADHHRHPDLLNRLIENDFIRQRELYGDRYPELEVIHRALRQRYGNQLLH